MHSNLVFSPPFDLNFDFPSKTPSFKTIVQTPASGRGEIRASLQPYPTWEIEYSLEWARGAEQLPNSVYQYVLGFFLDAKGQAGDFLYLDPNDNQVEAEFLAVGDGSTRIFQLQRSIGIGFDIVQNPGEYPPVTLQADGDDVSNTAWSMGTNGIVQFVQPPAEGVVLTWSGSYYYRVRFAEDALPFDQMMDRIWSAKSIKLRSVILT